MSDDDFLKRIDDSWIDVQRRVFTKWVNTYLMERMTEIEDLQFAFDDGLNLIALLEIISSKEVNEGNYNKRPRIRAQNLENLIFALDFLKNEGIRLENIGPEDIVDGNLKLILGLVWTIILRYQIQLEEGKSAKNALLEWVRSKIPDYDIKNFVNDWTDGSAINALADAVEPGVIDWNNVSGNALNDCDYCFNTCEQDMDIPAILLPEDMALNPDELANMTYISYFRDYELNKANAMEESERLKLPVAGNCVAYGPGLEPGNEAFIPTNFTIETRNYKNQPIPVPGGGVPYDVRLLGPDNNELVYGLQDNGDGTFYVEYTPEVPGIHKVEVLYEDDGHIKDSPFSVRVDQARIDPDQCRVYGPGLQDGDVGDDNRDIFIEPRNRFGDLIDTNIPLTVDVSGPFGDVECILDRRDDGVFVANYDPKDPGPYEIQVTSGRDVLGDSPYQVNIDRAGDISDPTKSYAEGPGLNPGNKTGDDCEFTIYSVDKFGQPRKVGGDLFDVFIEDPNFDTLEPELVDNDDGTYTVSYQPTEAGTYHVDVVQRNPANPMFYEHISNSPIDVEIEPGVDASQSFAYGPMLEDNVTDTLPTQFHIQSRDGNGNHMDEGGEDYVVEITDPDGNIITPIVQDNGDGTYTVDYEPENAGDHKVDVTLDGNNISNAPFTVSVGAGADFSKSYVEQYTFLLRTVDKRGENRVSGGDNVEVAIQGPSGDLVEDIQIRDIGDGTYIVIYSIPHDQPGEYTISTTIDGKDILGSPWKQFFD